MSYNKEALRVDLGKYYKPNPYKKDIITDPAGQWKYPGQPTRIPGNQITMQGVPYPVYGQDDQGNGQMMYPGEEYVFPGNYVDEIPMAQKGLSVNSIVNTPRSLAYNNKRITKGITTLPEIPIHPPQHRVGDSNIENVWEILDPSGFSSYNDVYDSYQKTGMSPQTMIEIVGALPLVGKVGKVTKGLSHLAKTRRQARSLNNYINALKAASLTGRASDTYQAYDQYKVGGIPELPLTAGRKAYHAWGYTNNDFIVNRQEGGPTYISDPDLPLGYNSVDDTINYDPNDSWQNINNPAWKNHEDYHHKQNMEGRMSLSGKVGQRPNPYVASDDAIASYYNRRETDLQNELDNMQKENPILQFIPREKLRYGQFDENGQPIFLGAEERMYSNPNTEEGEARLQEEEYANGGYIEADLTPEEIQQYRDGGYIVEDISVPSLNSFAPGGINTPTDLSPENLNYYLAKLRFLENSVKKGYKNKKWYPYESIEGGNDTIAYGHKILPGESFDKGITEAQAKRLQKKDALEKQRLAEYYVDKQYGKGTFDSLPQNSQMLLIDYQYNVSGGLSEFPNFTKALVESDKAKALSEYEREKLGQRNKWTKDVLENTYFPKQVDDTKPKLAEGGYTELELTPEEIQAYVDQGYTVEDID